MIVICISIRTDVYNRTGHRYALCLKVECFSTNSLDQFPLASCLLRAHCFEDKVLTTLTPTNNARNSSSPLSRKTQQADIVLF